MVSCHLQALNRPPLDRVRSRNHKREVPSCNTRVHPYPPQAFHGTLNHTKNQRISHEHPFRLSLCLDIWFWCVSFPLHHLHMVYSTGLSLHPFNAWHHQFLLVSRRPPHQVLEWIQNDVRMFHRLFHHPHRWHFYNQCLSNSSLPLVDQQSVVA